jgi:hypothetical protein
MSGTLHGGISFDSSENDKKKVVEKITTHIPYSVTPPSPPENRAPYEIMWENVVQPDGSQMSI